MATKTISVDLEAYRRLRAARISPNESFSRVIKRARWGDERCTASALLESSQELPLIDSETLERLGRGQESDAPPEDSWANE